MGVTLALALAAGCRSDDADLSHTCAQMTTSGKLPTCTALYDGSVGLKLPTGNAKRPYGAVSRSGEWFITADGVKLRLKPRVARPEAHDTGYATTVFRAEVDDDVATALTPRLTVSEDAILDHTFGDKILFGQISVRSADGSYDLDHWQPVAIQLNGHAAKGELGGTIANADTAVKLPSGKCLPALDRSSANPLADGFTRAVSLVRVPSMHVSFDDELVLQWNDSSSGMGNTFYPSVATAMGRDRIAGVWDVMQHGNPVSGPSLKLRLTTGHLSSC